MSLNLDESGVRRKLSVLLEGPEVRRGLEQLVADPFLVAFFLMSVSQGEGLGEAGVAAIREEEIARLLHDVDRQQREEASHARGTRDLARSLFPEYFDGDDYHFADRLDGRDYYVTVLQRNRQHLKDRGLYTRLNLYLTTTFGYEVMVVLYYGAVIDAVEASDLPARVKAPVAAELRRILGEEETHLGIGEQHDALLAADRGALGPGAVSMLEALERLTVEDYHFAAELSLREVARMITRYASGAEFRRRIEGGR